jgi:5-methylcytosine-specific restriction endonuclease McrA
MALSDLELAFRAARKLWREDSSPANKVEMDRLGKERNAVRIAKQKDSMEASHKRCQERRAKHEQVKKDRVSTYHDRWLEARKQVKQWRAEHPRKTYITTQVRANAARRARKHGTEGSYTNEEWQTLLEKYDNKCICCGKGDEDLTADHVIPIAEGGTDFITNIQPLCQSCNSRKGTHHTDFRKEYPK